jgi:two-component sensor histidine kinase
LQNVEGKTIRSLVPDLEAYWYDIFGRVAATGQPERFEGQAASLGRHFEGFAFALPEARRIGTLFMDVSSRKQSEAHLKLMVDELNHRVKNTLAVVQAIAQQTFKEDVVAADAKRAFLGRLASLAIAHNLLTRSHWEKTSLAELLRIVVAGCRPNPEQFAIDGPAVILSSAQAVSLSMAIHELCANAIKYGALSQPHGRVEISWQLSQENGQPRVRLTWREQGGPAVVAPTRHGFGLTMIEKALAYELGGTTAVDFRPGGIVCTIEAVLVSQLQPRW